jgi:PAS domain S-box-containing protein
MRSRHLRKTSFFEKVFLFTGFFLIISALFAFMLKRLTMNPDAELFSLMFGISICLRFYWPEKRWALQSIRFVALLLTLIILGFIFLNQLPAGKWSEFFQLRNWLLAGHPGVGDWIFMIHFYFFMAVISLLFGFSDYQKVAFQYISIISAVMLMVASIFNILITFSGIRLNGIDPVQFPLITQLSFFVLSLGLIIQAGKGVLYPAKEREDIDRLPTNLIWLFVFVAIVPIILGIVYFKRYEKDYRNAAWHQLSVITELKLNQIIGWRKHCLSDISIFYQNQEFLRRVHTYLFVPGNKEADQTFLMTWMSKFVETHDEYTGMYIYDLSMQRRITVGLHEPKIDSVYLNYMSKIEESEKILFSDLHRSENKGQIHLNIFVPLHDFYNPQHPLIAVLSLCIDPEKYLFPYLQNWPVPSRTAETLLIRRDKDRVVFLNRLRFDKNAALSLSFPLDQSNLPGVMAIKGVEGNVEGIDYRGVPVLATLRAVPDSPWYIVARIDKQEVFSDLIPRFFLLINLITVVILSEGLLFYLQWRRKALYFYQEQYRASMALRESEQRYRTLFETMHQGVFYQRPDGTIFHINKAALKIFGLSREEIFIEDLPILKDDIIHEDGSVIPQMDQPSMVALRTGNPVYDFVAGVFNPKSKQYVWLQINAIPQFIEGQKSPDHVVVTLHDITELKIREEARWQLSSRYRAILASVPDIIMEVDINKVYIWANETGKKFFGEDVIGKEASHYFIGIQDTYQQVQTLFDGDESVTYVESWQRRRDGEPRLLAWWCKVMKDAEGRVTGAISTARDITERVRAEQELHDREALLNEMGKTARIGGWEWNAKYENIKWTDEVYNICELPVDQNPVTVAGFTDYFHPDDKDRIYEGFDQAIKVGKSFDLELRLITAKDRQLWVRVIGKPKQLNEVTTQITGTIQDITVLKKAWQQVDRSLREKTVLLKEIHHRVKNNFQIISSLINLQNRQMADETMQSIFRSFQSRIHSMALVHEMMYHHQDFSRMNMHQYIENLVNFLKSIYHIINKRIEISVSCRDVHLNLNQAVPCGMIISELVSNAIKHAFPDDRKGKVKITMRQKPPVIRLSVSDDGIDFPDDRPLEQFKSLGMLIVKDLVKQLDGTSKILVQNHFKVFQIDFKSEDIEVAEKI